MDHLTNIFLSDPRYVPNDAEISAFELLMRNFAAHERHESGFLSEYGDVADRHANPLVRFLLQMIMSDEEKHHAVVHAMTSSLSEGFSGKKSEDAIPKWGEFTEAERDALLRLTTDFIKAEKAGIKEYKRLIKSSEGYYEGLFVLLIKTIIHDSQKHVMILEFIEKKLRES